MSSHSFATTGQDHCPFMPVFGPPQVMFVRGSGHRAVGRATASAISTSSAGSPSPRSATAHPVVAEAIAVQARTLLHVSNLFANDVATEAAILVDRLLAEATGEDGQVFFCNSGAEANECALEAGPQVRRPRPSCRRERAGQLPRAHPGHARRHRPAGQARAVLPDARRVPPRRVRRPRRPRGGGRPDGECRAHRAGAGRRRREPGPARATSRRSATCATSAGC